MARSRVGEWTDWVRRVFVIEGKEQEAAVRFKLVELTTDGERLRLYRSQVMLLDGVSEPPDLGRRLADRHGPYLEHASVLPYVWGIADLATSMEEADYRCQWIAAAGKELLESEGYSLLYTHIHLFDYVNHHFLPMVDPACPGYDPAVADAGWHAYREAYKVADRLIGTLMDDDPKDTAIVVVSDRAAIPQMRATDIYRLLADNGYLMLKVELDRFDPNEDFDKIQREVLTLLRTWVDRASGRCPVTVALPKKHAPLLGCWAAGANSAATSSSAWRTGT